MGERRWRGKGAAERRGSKGWAAVNARRRISGKLHPFGGRRGAFCRTGRRGGRRGGTGAQGVALRSRAGGSVAQPETADPTRFEASEPGWGALARLQVGQGLVREPADWPADRRSRSGAGPRSAGVAPPGKAHAFTDRTAVHPRGRTRPARGAPRIRPRSSTGGRPRDHPRGAAETGPRPDC